jgi:hypothetical protein
MATPHLDRSNVVDIQRARGRRLDFQAQAQARFAAARRASGLSLKTFADLLTDTLGWPVSSETAAAWESGGVPPGDVLLAAEQVAYPNGATSGLVPDLRMVGIPAAAMSIVDSYVDVQAALAAVVDDAREALAITGSRSRDPDYLTRIESTVANQSALVHYRVLYGPPRHGALKNHLLRLFDLHRRGDSLKIGMYSDLLKDSERFICASENAAAVVLPSTNSVSNFDTALVINDPDVALSYVAHVRQAYLGSEALTTRSTIENLEVLR